MKSNSVSEQRIAEMQEGLGQFNAILNCALDELSSGEAIEVLTLWREGDWPSLRRNYPEVPEEAYPPTERRLA